MKSLTTTGWALTLVIGLSLTTSAFGGTINGITNGDFSDTDTDPATPFPGWETPFFPLDFPPSDGGGVAVFAVDGFDFVELEQTFTLPTAADKLSFEIVDFFSGPGSFDPLFPPLAFDSFQATLIPLSGGPFLPAFYQLDVPTGFENFALGATKDPPSPSVAGTISLSLAGLAPGDYTLEFLLTGDFDGALSTVVVDNVQISLATSNVIPEPMSIAIWSVLGVALLPAVRRRRSRKVAT